MAEEAEGAAAAAAEGAAAEGAAAEGAAAEGAAAEGAAAEGAAAEGAPEAYADFTLPEGYQLNEAMHGNFQEVARSLNLSQEQAQQIIDLDAQRAQGDADAAKAAWDNQLAEWKSEVQNDEVLGKANYEQSMATANKAIDAFGSPELRAFLDESGLGTHPELLKAFHKVGSAISEDTLVLGDGGQSTAQPSFYRNSKMN
jgi:hypothetical protein